MAFILESEFLVFYRSLNQFDIEQHIQAQSDNDPIRPSGLVPL